MLFLRLDDKSPQSGERRPGTQGSLSEVWSSEPIILKCVSLKCMADVMKIRKPEGGLGFFCCQLTCQGGFVRRMQDADTSPVCHFVLILSWLCEEDADDLEAADMSHGLRNSSEQITASHPISVTVAVEAGASHRAFLPPSLCFVY